MKQCAHLLPRVPESPRWKSNVGYAAEENQKVIKLGGRRRSKRIARAASAPPHTKTNTDTAMAQRKPPSLRLSTKANGTPIPIATEVTARKNRIDSYWAGITLIESAYQQFEL